MRSPIAIDWVDALEIQHLFLLCIYANISDRAHMIRLYDDCSLTPRQRYSLDTSFRKRGGHVNGSIVPGKAFLFEQRL